MNQLETAYQIARLEIGTKEMSGLAHEKRILEYHQATTLKAQADETPWCASFINWCLIMAGFSCDISVMSIMLKDSGYSDDQVEILLDSFARIKWEGVTADRFKTSEPIFVPTKSALARHFLLWGKPIDSPKVGDLVILKRGKDPVAGHVGFFVSGNPFVTKVLGGNQSDQVKESRFFTKDILGYRTFRGVKLT